MNIKNCDIILGAGVTGLAIAAVSGIPVVEASDKSGGICRSYYISPKNTDTAIKRRKESFRFEIGGGHWLFGEDYLTLNYLKSLCQMKSYKRLSAVFFSKDSIFVPYPLQNNLHYLPRKITREILKEIKTDTKKKTTTLAEWLELKFGEKLCKLFFFPFHEVYTAGLYTKVAPQDKFKIPSGKRMIFCGIKENTPLVGYNANFLYPVKGLDYLIKRMEERCNIYYNKRVIKIDIDKREISFGDNSSMKYKQIISTLPLNRIIEMTGLELGEPNMPYNSVMVINIGAEKGKKFPEYQWLYIPDSKSGFYRVGFYSNVDSSFLPKIARESNKLTSIYIEKSYVGGKIPEKEEIRRLYKSVVEELQEWDFINKVEVMDHNWVEVAYTWQYPGSKLREKTISILQKNNIYQIGRYGKWLFQGIIDSIKEGISTGNKIIKSCKIH